MRNFAFLRKNVTFLFFRLLQVQFKRVFISIINDQNNSVILSFLKRERDFAIVSDRLSCTF
jgi:hypothetical protein